MHALCNNSSRRSRIFLKRGPLSCEVPSRRDSVGGGGAGGSSRIFPWSPKADAFQWGGGSSTIFFRGLHEFSVNGALFSVVSTNFQLMGPFYIFRVAQRGGRAPWAPPPESATEQDACHWSVVSLEAYMFSAKTSFTLA